jgi:hypothetical protein
LLNTSARLPVARLTRISAPVPAKFWSSTMRLPPVASVVTLLARAKAGPAPTPPPEIRVRLPVIASTDSTRPPSNR